MRLYLVCESSRGAHEYSGVYSIWSSREAAIAEGERLTAQNKYTEIEIAEAELDQPFVPDYWGEPDINWVPKSLKDYKLASMVSGDATQGHD